MNPSAHPHCRHLGASGGVSSSSLQDGTVYLCLAFCVSLPASPVCSLMVVTTQQRESLPCFLG